MVKPHSVLIVGGGVAGLSIATKLGRSLGRSGKAEITLIDASPIHVWKPMLHTFAAGTSNSYQQRISMVVQANRFSFRFLPGAMKSVDADSRTLITSPIRSKDGNLVINERTLKYDTLILAAGSRANDFDTSGVQEHCFFIDSLRQAENFNDSFYDQLLQTAETGRTLDIAIVGGGATGVELAAEISQLITVAETYGAGDLHPKLNLTLIESSPRILGAFPENVAAAAARQLEALGVKVLTGVRVTQADETGFVFANGQRVDAALKVWAAGIKAPEAFDGLAGFEKTRAGQVVVTPSLQSVSHETVFAVGDCSSLTLAGQERPLPATAQVARQQAIHIGRHLPAHIAGAKIPDFVFKDRGSLVSLSRYNAFGTLGRVGLFKPTFIQGKFAQLSHAMLYRLHQAELHGPIRAGGIWLSDAISSLVRPSIRVD